MSFSRSFERTERIEIGLLLEGSVLYLDLYSSITLACLNDFGKYFFGLYNDCTCR